MKKITAVCFLFFLAAVCMANGFTSLQLGSGAKPGGIGLAYTAMSGDALAGYWNPAGLVNIPKNDVVFSMHRWIQDVNSGFFSYGKGNKRHGFGLHFLYTEIGGIEQRLVASPDPISVFSAYDMVLGLSYGIRLNDHIRWGFTLKGLYKKILYDEAKGIAADLGIQYDVGVICLAGVLQNIGKTDNLRSESLSLPVTVKVGAAIPMKLIKSNWIVLIDGIHEFGEEFYCHGGVEWSFNNQLALRGGFQLGYEDIRLTGGLGVLWKMYRLDYSTMPSVNGLGHSHRLGIGINW